MVSFRSASLRERVVAEKPLARPQDDGVDDEPVLVNEIVLHQRRQQLAAAVDENVPTRLLLQFCDFLREVALDDVRVVPLGWFETRRGHILLVAVHAGGTIAFLRHVWQAAANTS